MVSLLAFSFYSPLHLAFFISLASPLEFLSSPYLILFPPLRSSLFGVPTGLLALQGTEAEGIEMRTAMKLHGISTEYLQVSDSHASAVSIVVLQDDGERAILMAKGSTGTKMKKKQKHVGGRLPWLLLSLGRFHVVQKASPGNTMAQNDLF